MVSVVHYPNLKLNSTTNTTMFPVNPNPDKDEEDDSSDPNTNPCHNDKFLQIFSFISLFILVAIAIGFLVDSGHGK